MNTLGEGYHEYIGGGGGSCVHQGYSVHRRDILIHVGGYHEYIEGCSVHRKDIMDISGGYHDSCGEAN